MSQAVTPRKPSTGTATAETQTNLPGILIFDDPETKDAEAQTIEEEDVVWVSHVEAQTSDDGILYVDTPSAETSNCDMVDAQQIAIVAFGHQLEPVP